MSSVISSIISSGHKWGQTGQPSWRNFKKGFMEHHYVRIGYYRLREVRKACLQNIPEESSAQSIVPVPSNLITSNTNSAIEITIGKIQITVSDATSPVLLEDGIAGGCGC